MQAYRLPPHIWMRSTIYEKTLPPDGSDGRSLRLVKDWVGRHHGREDEHELMLYVQLEKTIDLYGICSKSKHYV